MSAIDNAIAALQDLALSCTSVTIKSAPDYPIENADPFPFSAAYLRDGNFYAANSSTVMIFPVVSVEFHFTRANLKSAYQGVNAIAIEFAKKLAGTPTLGAAVTSIVAAQGNPITFNVAPFVFGNIQSVMLKFDIPLKIMETPTT